MNYYKRHIGDYHKKAGRLSMLEHGAYTLLLDACYDREKFPTKDEAIDWCWARSSEEIAAVEFVLSKFFVFEGGVYVQSTISENVSQYHENALKNKQIAIEREEARRIKREQVVHEPARTVHESPPNHKPLTINHKPILKETSIGHSDESPKQDFLAELFVKFWKNYPVKQKKANAEKSFRNLFRGKSQRKAEMETYALLTYYHDHLVGVEFGADKLHPTSYLNQKRWQDNPEFMEKFEQQWEKDNEQPV